jgi:RHS repeat-associated protein
LTGSSLVVGGVDSLTGGEQSEAQRNASSMSPEAQSLRSSSQTAYEGLSASEAEGVVNSAFASVVNEPDGGPPVLPEGQSIVGFPSDYSASLSLAEGQHALSEGQHAVLESSLPIAAQGPGGVRVPLNLRPQAVGGGYEAVTPSVGMGVRAGGRLSEGVSLTGLGMSLTPVTSAGVPLEASGVVDGASVFYGDSEDQQAGIVDLDSLVKLDAHGFREDSILRSERAPSKLYFKVGLPQGATLAQEGSGSVVVVAAGRPIASITTAAQDAEGTVVPVSVSVAGELLVLTVEHAVGQYRMPVEVDPSVSEGESMGRYQMGKNWEFAAESPKGVFTNYEPKYGVLGMEDHNPYGGEYVNGEFGLFGYETVGESRIYAFVSKSYNKNNSAISSTVYIAGKSGLESSIQTAGENTVCVAENCAAVMGGASNWENGAFYKQTALAKEWGPFEDLLESATVYVVQEKGPSVVGLGTCGSTWTNASACSVELKATDPGLGVSEVTFSSPNSAEWGGKEKRCSTIQCNQSVTAWEKLTGLPEGEDTVKGTANDPVGLSASSERTVKIDNAPPHNLALSGLGPGNQVGPGEYKLKAEATDGSGGTRSSGMSSMAIWIDGREVGSSSASCSPGPCTGHSATWPIFGHNYATGRHTVTISATDNAGNTATEKLTMTVHPASPVALGPGAVNPQSGEYRLTATDVSMGGGLTVSRGYGSQHLSVGAGGPLGSQWGFSLGGQESLVKQPDGSMVLIDGSGAQTIFSPNGSGGYISPAGDSNLTLSSTPCEAGQTEFMLKNVAANTTTCFKVPSGGSGEVWSPSIAKGPVATDTVTYTYETVEVPTGSKKTVTRPNEALAPVPTGVSCSPTLNAGCRALTFNYASTTTAKGEVPAEWGDVEGNLTRVYFTAYDPASKAMKKVEVARYLYDKQARLRAEWDPRISPALKTTYGYDPEGHVTAVSSSGQEPWMLRYGAIKNDASSGRLLSVTRPSASTALGNGSTPQNTAAPTLSTSSPAIGTTLSVSTNGTWNNSPLAYSYQWEDCNSSGGECHPILGATNQGYTPQASDAGYTLVAQVTAVNAGGSTTASSVASSTVPISAPSFSLSFGSAGEGAGQFKEPQSDAVDASGNVWVTDDNNNRVDKFGPKGEYLTSIGSTGKENGQFIHPFGIAINRSTGNIYVGDSNNNRIEEFSSGGTFLTAFGSAGSGPGQFSDPLGLAVDPNGNVWAVDYYDARVEEFSETGTYIGAYGSKGSGSGQFLEPLEIAFAGGNAYITDRGNNRVEEFSSSGAFISQFGAKGSGNGQFVSPYGIVTDPGGEDIYVADEGNDRIQEFNQAGVYLTKFGSYGKENGQFYGPVGLAVNASRELYAVDDGNNRVEKWIPTYSTNNPLPTPPNPGTSSVSTVEYNVALSGTGLPNMTATEVEKGWAQKDTPAEATAVFPPDEPQGWPASDYKRATIYYRDSTERTVNVAAPNGAISTSEYNEINDVTRSLSVDDRAASLKEGAKSAEVAKLLDTQSTYNSEGTELLSTLGPRHTVKLANGKEVQARSHTVNSYDEGAPSEGGPYRLVTKTTQGAQIEGESEQDVRTTQTSYSGQENLGWKLRKATSVTADPGGLNLTHATVYDPTTGNVLETQAPAASGKDAAVAPAYSTSFGSYGSGSGQLHNPTSNAVDPSGNVWVADADNQRIEEFSPSGTFMLAVGWGVKDGKAEAETCTTGCQAGVSGSGNGQFNGPMGIAINQSTGHIYVCDYSNSRVEEFSSTGTFLAAIGSFGTGNGQFENPTDIAIESSTGDLWVADNGNYRIEKFSSTGTFIGAYGSRGTGNGQFDSAYGIAFASGNVYVTDYNNNRVQELSSSGAYVRQFGTKGSGNGQFNQPLYITTNPTNGNLYVSDIGNYRVEEFSISGAYLTQFGSKGSGNGQFSGPEGLAINSSGNVYVVDSSTNERVQEWVPAITGNAGAHDTQTIYYSAGANTKYPACGGHPEWANLPCETKPAAQPGTSGLPELPASTVTYNIWGEPLITTSTSGSATRTTTNTYDEASRPLTSETTSTVGTAVPKVTDKYSETTGALTEQSTSSESLKNVFNTLGQLTSYTDADGNTSTFEYETEKDARLKKVNDGKGIQTYTYNETTGALSNLKDTAAGTFTAGYDVEGNMTSEGYPNGMSAIYTYNQLSAATSLVYKKETHCTEKCEWFKDSVVPSIHGQWASQTSSLGQESYTYDQTGRLTEVQNTPAGKGCITRRYAYDEDTNRTSLTTYPPNSKNECATESLTFEQHTYDTADRLTDTGASYDAFGNTTGLPAGDAGGSELTSSYYADNQLASQKQAGETIGYNPDPAGRTREIASTGKIVASEIQHYAGASGTPAWTGEMSGQWTRNITAMSGLSALQHNSETPVLQLANLHGDIIATASLSETATELASTVKEASEYGVPATEAPPKYSWLGAHELPTALPSGVMAMGARSYVPQLGRFLQTDPIAGGSANAYAYVYGDPVNSNDLAGERAGKGLSSWAMGVASQISQNEVVAYETAIREEAERKAHEAAEQARAYAAIMSATPEGENYQEEGPEEEYWEEEGEEYEYASYHYGGDAEHAKGHAEEGLLFQPLEEGASPGGGEESSKQGARRDVAGGCPSTHDPCWKDVKGGHSRPSKGSSCRSGGKRDKHGRCEVGRGGSGPVSCSDAAAAAGGVLGGLAGGVSGPGGALVGGAAGSYAGSKVC